MPPQDWGSGQGDPYGGPPPRNNTPLLVVLAVVTVAALGGSIFFLTRGGDEGSEREQADEASAGEQPDEPTAGEQADAASAEEQAYVDAIAAATQQDDETISLSADQSHCYAEAVVDIIGVDALREVATPAEIHASAGGGEDPLDEVSADQGQAEALYDETSGCIDWRDTFLEAMGQEGLTEDQMACVEGQVTEDVVRTIMVAAFVGDDAGGEQVITDAVEPCAGT